MPAMPLARRGRENDSAPSEQVHALRPAILLSTCWPGAEREPGFGLDPREKALDGWNRVHDPRMKNLAYRVIYGKSPLGQSLLGAAIVQ